jgi:hypothetical protein
MLAEENNSYMEEEEEDPKTLSLSGKKLINRFCLNVVEVTGSLPDCSNPDSFDLKLSKRSKLLLSSRHHKRRRNKKSKPNLLHLLKESLNKTKVLIYKLDNKHLNKRLLSDITKEAVDGINHPKSNLMHISIPDTRHNSDPAPASSTLAAAGGAQPVQSGPELLSHEQLPRSCGDSSNSRSKAPSASVKLPHCKGKLPVIKPSMHCSKQFTINSRHQTQQ